MDGGDGSGNFFVGESEGRGEGEDVAFGGVWEGEEAALEEIFHELDAELGGG